MNGRVGTHLSLRSADKSLSTASCPQADAAPVVPDRVLAASLPPKVRERPPSAAKALLVAADAGAVVLAGAAAAVLLQRWDTEAHEASLHLFWATVATVPVWIGLFSAQRLYNTRFIGRRIDEIHRIVNASLLGTMSVAVAANVANILLRRSGLVILALCAVTFVSLEREAARRVFNQMRSTGRMTREVIVAGANPEGRDIAAMLQTESWLGYKVIGFVDDSGAAAEPVPGVSLLGTTADLPSVIANHPSAGVIVAASGVDSAVTNRMARDLLDRGIHVELSSTLRDIASERLTVRPLGRFPMVYVEPITRDGWRAGAKRAFDLTVGTLSLIVAAPILLVAAIAIKLDSRGPVLFRQTRVGQNSKPFNVLKLRSMVTDAEAQLVDLIDLNEADGPLFKMAEDPRITRVGRLIRATSIDELPQLWNVVRGDMSLVGPRPALPHETEEWDSLLAQRLRVKPGITGMWQVNGRSDTSFEDYTRLDLYYVDNWTLTTDLAIMLKTVPAVVLRQGAH
ncbi:MAG: sugar transferase [Microthrixaceae bacterium]|nr:sugar transferase [Acidimicrobiales bacterium]MCB9404861.1 sugar transferase [Microthrixaceae bacterium]